MASDGICLTQHYTDWLPTLPAVAGSAAPALPAPDGINVLPVLQGEEGQVLDTRFWQWNRYTPLRQYERDPEEKTDLADKHPAKVSRMLGEIDRWFRSVEANRTSITD